MPVIDLQKEEEEARVTKPKTYTWLAIVVLVVSILMIGSVFGVIYLYSMRYQEQINTLEQEIARLKQLETQKNEEAAEAIEVSKKIAALDSVLSEHVCMTEVFKQLEETTIKKAFFESLDLSAAEGGLALIAKAATYQDVANQLAVWRDNDEFFKTVEVNEVVIDEATEEGKNYVSFAPAIKLEKDKFLCRKEVEEKTNKNNNNK